MDFDLVVIGAGAIGLAIAARLGRPGRSVLVLERAGKPGSGVTSRNSQIVHAGIYYPPETLKSRLCLRGAELLYEFAVAHQVACLRTGKLIVATDPSEQGRLEAIWRAATAAGCRDLRLITQAEVAHLESNVACHSAMHSPNTGIIDVAEYVRALVHQCRSADVVAFYGAEVDSVAPIEGGYAVGIGSTSVQCRCVVNAAGLQADRIANVMGIDLDRAGYRHRYVKGSYFAVRGRAETRVDRPVYPLPEPDHAGLGVHLTVDTSGQMRLGPDVEPLPEQTEDYRVSAERLGAFVAAAQRFLPALRSEDLSPDMAGIRPKLARPSGYPDFLIVEESKRGLPGVVNLLGIESPGLTASLAIAEHVETLLQQQL